MVFLSVCVYLCVCVSVFYQKQLWVFETDLD